MAFNSLSSSFPLYLLFPQILKNYRYPFNFLFLIQQGLFPIQTNDITLTSNPSSPICTVCRNFTINSGVTYAQSYISVVATNSITINGSIDCSVTARDARTFLGNTTDTISFSTSLDSDIPTGGGKGSSGTVVYGFGGGSGGNAFVSSLVNPPFFKVIYGKQDSIQNTGNIAFNGIVKNNAFISGEVGSGGASIAGGIVILCAPTININGDVLAYGRDASASANVLSNGGGVIYLVGGNITISNVNVNAKGGNATSASSYSAYGGGGGFIVIAGTKSITNDATINVSGGTASGGSNNYNGQNGSLIVKTFSFYDFQL